MRVGAGAIAVMLLVAPALAQAPPGQQLRDVLAGLSPAGRTLFTHGWAAPMRVLNAAHRMAVAQAQDAVFAAMLAEPFDARALRRAYAAERRVAADYQLARQERLVAILAQMTPGDRRIMVTRLTAMRDARRR